MPFVMRLLTVGVVSYLAHIVWTNKKMLTAGWYTEEQTKVEHVMVTAFEYLSTLGLIFAVGTLTGVIFGKLAEWLKGTVPLKDSQATL